MAEIPFQSTAQNTKSEVIIFGGAVNENTYHALARHAKVENKTVTIITSASRDYAKTVDQKMIDVFKEHGAQFYIIDENDLNNKDSLNFEGHVAALNKSRLVWIAGGDQGHLAKMFEGTEAYKALKTLYETNPDLVIAGNSAGAAIMPSRIINGGGPERVVEYMREGWGFSPYIVDTHVDERNRIPRAMAVMKHEETPIANVMVCLSENSAVRILTNGDIRTFDVGGLREGRRIHLLEKMPDKSIKHTTHECGDDMLIFSPKFQRAMFEQLASKPKLESSEIPPSPLPFIPVIPVKAPVVR